RQCGIVEPMEALLSEGFQALPWSVHHDTPSKHRLALTIYHPDLENILIRFGFMNKQRMSQSLLKEKRLLPLTAQQNHKS
ncbi:hypothetical protein HispidOSU_001902, partial [Sigmodon hispidus]